MKKIEISAKTKKILGYVGGAIAVVGAVAGAVYLVKRGQDMSARIAEHEAEGQRILNALSNAMQHPDNSVEIFEGLDNAGNVVASLVVDADFNVDDIGSSITFMNELGNHFTMETTSLG